LIKTRIIETISAPSPFGRVHEFKPKQTYRGLEFNESDITNHPNQGLGADIVSMIRVLIKTRLFKQENLRCKLISTVHDSIVCDLPDDEIEFVANLFSQTFRDLPRFSIVILELSGMFQLKKKLRSVTIC
jgi:DNA polymerase I-like protein with 3'-5' exonuclease and polymerase domains